MNAGSRPGAMLQFRLTCERHRTFFLDIMHKHRIHDPARMEHVRLEFVKYVASVYPASYVKHLQESSCMGCAFEAAGESCQAWALETFTAFCRGLPPPPAVFKTWLDKSVV
jgi:hypothetical protein